MADEAEVNLSGMRPDDRAAWIRRQLVRLPGVVEATADGRTWKVLEHQASLSTLMVSLCTGQLSESVCRDLNGRLREKGWRNSEGLGNGRMSHSILILPEDGLIPAKPDDEPTADAAVTTDPEAEELSVEDLEAAARAMHWAASRIVTLQNRVGELEEENKELQARLDAAEAVERERPRPDAQTVLVFRDGLNSLSGLQEP